MNNNKKIFYHLPSLLFIIGLSFLSYYGTSGHVLLHWDDLSYITYNPWVTNPSMNNIFSLFSEIRMNNWHPLTWLSFIPEYALCGSDASCYKITNIILHCLNSILVYFLFILILNFNLHYHDKKIVNDYSIIPLNTKIKYTSLLASILFAVHPQHTESVIWVTERKDLLCAFFYLLTLIYYIKNNIFNVGLKLIPFVFFSFALMSKSMAVSLPFILIILDIYYYKLRFEQHDDNKNIANNIILEKLPYFLLTLIIIFITMFSQETSINTTVSVFDKVQIVLVSLFHYLGTFIYPFTLSPFYPLEIINDYSPIEYIFCLIAIVISISILVYFKFTRITLILLTFIISIAPVIGIVTIGQHLYADRYTYIPMVGFYLLLSIGIFKLFDYTSDFIRRFILFLLACIVLIFSLSTNNYKNMWQDDITLWKYVELKYSGISAVVHQNLGNSYHEISNYQKAISHYNIALKLQPFLPNIALPTYKNLGLTYKKLNDPVMALLNFSKAAIDFPQIPESHINYAEELFFQKKYKKALKHYLEARELLNEQNQSLFDIEISILQINLIINYNNDQYMKFIEQLNALNKLHPGNPRVKFLINNFTNHN